MGIFDGICLTPHKYILFDGFTFNTHGYFGKIRAMSKMSVRVIFKTIE